ncbi:hypothetical protein GCM10010384_33720 [Streptomyces djakartensis]|uniref:Uncharacterized protein n=1 Tax=Streptomyces djakartensis TaxID=68193 RepID=A0ABQ2ZSI6_9ACTN|nr:hypothetical protein GCM10010384_33720 [Streptomyces djakartensis]
MPESATECTDSASIDDEPLKRNATNFATAIARLAASAATIALVPPDALMCPRCPFVRRSWAGRRLGATPVALPVLDGGPLLQPVPAAVFQVTGTGAIETVRR